ncbi:MAG: hypothetical protein JXA04_08640 [Gammaproteobacteria bacterium]|nr:hypothetical protein [Gammaproteobacteria bacterium]
MKKQKLIAFFLLLCCLHFTAAQQLTIIQLKNRQADELIDTIKPMLQLNEGVSGHGYELYLNAGPETTRNIQTLVEHLDKTPAQLLISVRNTNTVTNDRSGITISGSLGNDHIRIKSGNQNGVQLQASNQIASTLERNTPQIRATEGQPALVFTGTSVPIRMTDRRRNNGYIVEHDVIDYHPVENGYYVTAWLNGDNVRLDLKQKNDSLLTTGAINVSRVETTVHGKLGEWIPVSGINTSRSNSTQNGGGSSVITTGSRDLIYIKVERLE